VSFISTELESVLNIL